MTIKITPDVKFAFSLAAQKTPDAATEGLGAQTGAEGTEGAEGGEASQEALAKKGEGEGADLAKDKNKGDDKGDGKDSGKKPDTKDDKGDKGDKGADDTDDEDDDDDDDDDADDSDEDSETAEEELRDAEVAAEALEAMVATSESLGGLQPSVISMTARMLGESATSSAGVMALEAIGDNVNEEIGEMAIEGLIDSVKTKISSVVERMGTVAGKGINKVGELISKLPGGDKFNEAVASSNSAAIAVTPAGVMKALGAAGILVATLGAIVAVVATMPAAATLGARAAAKGVDVSTVSSAAKFAQSSRLTAMWKTGLSKAGVSGRLGAKEMFGPTKAPIAGSWTKVAYESALEGVKKLGAELTKTFESAKRLATKIPELYRNAQAAAVDGAVPAGGGIRNLADSVRVVAFVSRVCGWISVYIVGGVMARIARTCSHLASGKAEA